MTLDIVILGLGIVLLFESLLRLVLGGYSSNIALLVLDFMAGLLLIDAYLITRGRK